MKIVTETFNIMGSPLFGVNPLPNFRDRKPTEFKCDDKFPDKLKETLGTCTKVLPYLMQDRYSEEKKELKLKSFVLENDYLKVRVLPEYGGRIHSIYDKKNGCNLLFENTVIRPGNLAIRNAWLSGGIEWNIGNFGHTYTTCDNVYCAKLTDKEGNDFLRIYEFERNKSIFWQLDMHLPDNSEHLITHVRMVNPFTTDTTTYWWTNIAVPTTEKTRVIASEKKVISFVDGTLMYETLPSLEALPGVDPTYPENETARSYDYFIQKDSDDIYSTWEAAAFEDGTVFYERSTAPLYYKKLFCWGTHHAGKHWQEFLSAGKGTGYYAELQAGIAPSQLHDMKLCANSKYEWTQCFGGMKLSPDKLISDSYDSAVEYFDSSIDNVLSEYDIKSIDSLMQKYADIPVTAENIIHSGSGFGALEALRMKIDGDGNVPESMFFPIDGIGAPEKPWHKLLTEGKLPEALTTDVPLSYMTSAKWIDRLEKCSDTWNGLLHYGVAIYELHDTTVLANQSYNAEKDYLQVNAAKQAFLESVKMKPNAWAYRNLAVIANAEGNCELAKHYYEQARKLPEIYSDYAILSEYMQLLVKNKQYRDAWDIYTSLPESFKTVDRIKITVAVAAVKLSKLDYLESFFAEKHIDIREGESSLTDIWFEYSARKLASERNISELTDEKLEALIDEAWDICPPDESIDFRMSLDKKTKYRI